MAQSKPLNAEMKALLAPLAALVLWGFWAFLPKLAMQSMSAPAVTFYEGVGSLLVALPLLFFIRGKLIRNAKAIGLVVCASSLSVIAILCYYAALKIGPVATVSTITAMYPIVGIALARVFLGEKMNALQFIAAAMAMLSVYLLAG
jgi:drug/metabolite transporter (DMT)-like permease